MKTLLLATLLLMLSSCTQKEPESAELTDLKKHWANLQTAQTKLQNDLKTSSDDAATKRELVEEQFLLESRMKRAREKFKELGQPLEDTGPTAAGGGGHH
jgi:outer membrane lipoprotein-sorting protein